MAQFPAIVEWSNGQQMVIFNQQSGQQSAAQAQYYPPQGKLRYCIFFLKSHEHRVVQQP